MIDGEKKLKPIDITPFTEVTPEMAEEMGKFAEQMLPVVDELIRDIEIISNGEEEGQQQS
jgi:molecular chaperone GrpE (heat shock protein)